MGCPPDPMEVDALRADQEKTRVVSLYEELGLQKEKTLILYQQIQKLLPDKNAYLELIKAIEKAIPEKEEPQPEQTSEHLDYITYKYEENSALLNYESKRLKNRETSLCIIREAVLALAGEIPVDTITEELKNKLNNELDLYILHRENDRQLWIKWIEGSVCVFEYYLELAQKAAKKQIIIYLQEGIQKLQKEKSRVLALTVKDLISSRTLFGQDPEKFELDYEKVSFY